MKMMDINELNDIEFGDLLRKCVERLEAESKDCVRIEDTFLSWFIIQMDNDELTEYNQNCQNFNPIKQKEFIHFPRTEMLLDASYNL